MYPVLIWISDTKDMGVHDESWQEARWWERRSARLSMLLGRGNADMETGSRKQEHNDTYLMISMTREETMQEGHETWKLE